MNTSDAFILAGKINFHYNRKLTNSIAINTEIAQALGSDLYKKFSEEISLLYKKSLPIEQSDLSKDFSSDFLKNPLNDEDCINDRDVCVNFSFESLMEALAETTSI